MKNLTESQFEAQFTVVDGPDGDSVRPTHDGIEPDSKHLWTVVDADGSLYALSGLHFVNRIGYLVTEQTWDQDIEAVWYEAPADEDDNDEEEKETSDA